MLLERGISVSYETIRRWALKFGTDYARRLKRKAPAPRDVWRLDEVVISINGERRYLWRAVDQDERVLDEVVQIHRDTRAAQRLLTRLLRTQGCPPKWIITASARTPRPSERSCRKLSIASTRVEQPGGELPPTDPETRTNDAGLSIMVRIAAVRLNLLRRPKSFRTASLSALRNPNSPSSLEGVGGVESRHSRCGLNTDRITLPAPPSS